MGRPAVATTAATLAAAAALAATAFGQANAQQAVQQAPPPAAAAPNRNNVRRAAASTAVVEPNHNNDPQQQEQGRALNLLSGAVRAQPSVAADAATTGSAVTERRHLSNYARKLESARSDHQNSGGNRIKQQRHQQQKHHHLIKGHSRILFNVLLDFPECYHLEAEECMNLINKEYSTHKNVFDGQKPVYEPRKIRNYNQNNYNKVAIWPCEDGVHACGTEGDGIITYPFAYIMNGIGYEVGPWDCNTGIPLTLEECCTFVTSSIPHVDDRGRKLECYYPPEERVNPKHDPHRIVLPIDTTTRKIVSEPYAN